MLVNIINSIAYSLMVICLRTRPVQSVRVIADRRMNSQMNYCWQFHYLLHVDMLKSDDSHCPTPHSLDSLRLEADFDHFEIVQLRPECQLDLDKDEGFLHLSTINN